MIGDAVVSRPVARVPDEHLRHKVILASAGSGKTHQLSGRYLSLMATGAEASSILASTFTRLAAGEIRDRLLKRLADAINDGTKRAELAESLHLEALSSPQVMAILRGLARNLHTLKVGTLDAFFASVVFAFAFELGLPLGATIVDEPDNQALRLEAIRLMLDEEKPQDVIELLRLLTRGQSERYVTGIIDRVVEQLYDLWRECPAEAWDCVPEIEGQLSRQELVDALADLRDCPLPKDRNFIKAHQSNWQAAMAHDWVDFLRSGLARKIAAGEMTYYSKQIPSLVVTAYQRVITHAIAELVNRLREQTLATRDLLARFHTRYQRLKVQHGVLTFADLTHAMAQAAAHENTLEAMSFRLDGQIQHLLLDEFQDTSIAQWRALAPMAREIVAHAAPLGGRTFFCVGDVKQSIYGWRNANPEILEHLPRLLPGVNQESLDRSWRSSPIIIETVNTVFGSLTSNRALATRQTSAGVDEDDDTHAIAADLWQAGFHRHEVVERNENLPGYVQVRFGPMVQDRDRPARKRRRLKAAAELTADLHRAAPHLRIALLTRSNDAVAWLLYNLGGAGIAASGRGGGPLIDAPPVNALLDLLRLADHPDDTVSAFNIAASPLGPALGFTQFKVEAERRRLSRQTRESLLHDGYQATLAKWVALLAPACDARELRRAAQLVDLAGAFDRQQAASNAAALRPGHFIRLVEVKEVPDSQPAPVEVMTIHQAKGLEFDAVVLAELDWHLRGQDPTVVYERGERSGEITRISRWIKSDVIEHLPELQPVVRQHRIRTIRESLSLLYVAMTRPRCALYLLVDPPSESEGNKLPRNAGGMLRAALVGDSGAPETVVFEDGDREWWQRIKAPRSTQAEKDKTTAVADRIALAASAPEGEAAVRGESATSASEFALRSAARKQAAALRNSLRLTSPEGRERGRVVHALFEQVEWLKDFDADDAALVLIARKIAPRRDERWLQRQVAAFRGMLRQPAIAHIMSRPAEAHVLLHREYPFARIVNGRVQSGAIDRLMVCVDDAGRAIRATIIDFKTDAIEDSGHAGSSLNENTGAQAHAEIHRPQLEAYRDAVSELFGLGPEMIAMHVLLAGKGAIMAL